MPRSGSSTLPPHSRAITGIACSAKSCICECAPTGRAARCRPQMVRLLLTGWLVGAANLPRLLPDAGDLLHCEEARHLDVLNGTGGYSDTGDSGCHSGVSLRSGLATLLGAAGEQLGYDRHLKTNTTKRRTHSLFRQRNMLYELMPNMTDFLLLTLIKRFA